MRNYSESPGARTEEFGHEKSVTKRSVLKKSGLLRVITFMSMYSKAMLRFVG